MRPTTPAIPMESEEFRLLRDVIRDSTGILFSEENSFLIQRRLQPRLEVLGLARFIDYYLYLSDPRLPAEERARELDEIFERIATRETYFFREGYQLQAFREELLPRIHRERRRGERLTVWSAGCSTGEEPYTLAIEILESGLFAGWKVEVVGSDLSQSALGVARAGVYGNSSFRQTEKHLSERYFTEVGGRRQVTGEVRALVSFHRLNLHQQGWALPAEPFDVIFCRNVLIYFDRGARPMIVDRFYRKLVPGGYLLLGHSESLLDTPSAFDLHHLKRELVYRKPGP